MNKYLAACFVLFTCFSCDMKNKQINDADINTSFDNFQPRFLDAYWKANPSAAIFAGYGKYYDSLVIPGSAAFAGSVSF